MQVGLLPGMASFESASSLQNNIGNLYLRPRHFRVSLKPVTSLSLQRHGSLDQLEFVSVRRVSLRVFANLACTSRTKIFFTVSFYVFQTFQTCSIVTSVGFQCTTDVFIGIFSRHFSNQAPTVIYVRRNTDISPNYY